MKRILRRLLVKEISAVDRPAQVHAKVLIMKRDGGADMESLQALLESVASIFGDDELSVDEREAMLRQTFEQYNDFTGRDGLADIAAAGGGDFTKTEKGTKQMQNIDRGALAMLALEGAAEALRKANPELTKEQAFAKAYTDPANREAMKAEREASRARLSGFNIARTEPEIVDPDDDAEIKRLVDEERRSNPYLTNEQLFSRVYSSPEMVRHRAAFREAMARARRDGSTLKSDAIAKRDDALAELKAKAAELRKAQPHLSEAQAFSKTYSDPSNRMLAAAERAASRAALFAV